MAPTHFARRSPAPTGPNALTLALARERSAGRPVLDLTASNPTTVGLEAPGALLTHLADARALRYDPHPLGLFAAREALAAHLTEAGTPATPDRLLLAASTSELYGYTFRLLCDPGDEVLVPRPSYPLLDHLARLESVRLVPYPLAWDGEWHIDAHELTRRVTPRTRAVIVVSPNNPTGSYLKAGELSALARLGLPIIADEVFAPYVLDGPRDPAPPITAQEDLLAFSLGGLSKSAGMPQLKLAWAALGGPTAVVAEARERLEVIADTYLSPGTPVQVALGALLAGSAPLRAAIHARIREGLATIRAGLGAGTAVTVYKVEGGWYAVLRLPRTLSDEGWALRLVEADGVWVHPGYFYDFEADAHLVVSLLTPPDVLREAVRRVAIRVDLEG